MKFSKMLFAAFVIFAMVGCEKDPSDEQGGDNTAGYTLVADKTVIEADGVDAVTFSVVDSSGFDIASESDVLAKIAFFEEGGSRLKAGTREFTAFRDGTYTFYANFKGKRTKNDVTITVKNRKVYEKYQHKVCIFQCTGTWCGYCPLMTAALKGLKDGVNRDNYIVLAAHASTQGAADPYSIPYGKDRIDLGNVVCGKFGGAGFPFAVYDLAFGTLERTTATANGYIEVLLKDEPAHCGVKITKAQIDAEGNATIEASVKAQYDGEYDLAWAVLADNQPKLSGNEEIYNDVIMAVSENLMGMSKDTKVTLKADEEYTKTFTFKVEPFKSVPFNPADCKVVVMAHNDKMIDNANICAVGSSVDYAYNK